RWPGASPRSGTSSSNSRSRRRASASPELVHARASERPANRMAPASEKPAGLVYEPELISAGEERALLDELAGLRFDPIVLHGQRARRTARHFGLDYDYDARTPAPGEPIPDWLLPARRRASQLSSQRPEE